MSGLGARASCGRCGRTIELRAVSKRPTAVWRWYSSTKADSWHCGSDPRHPVLAHDPNAAPLRKPIEQVETETAETVRVASTIASVSEPARDQLAFHTDGTPCERAVTTRDCPEQHRYVTGYGHIVPPFPPALAAAAYHDYESPRSERAPTEPCAVCGLSYGAVIHA